VGHLLAQFHDPLPHSVGKLLVLQAGIAGEDGWAAQVRCAAAFSTTMRSALSEVVPELVELEVAVPHLKPASR
jgi:hypothetical protein